jgi:hypothetical protein
MAGTEAGTPMTFDCGTLVYEVKTKCNDGMPDAWIENDAVPHLVALVDGAPPITAGSSFDCEIGNDTTGGRAVDASMAVRCASGAATSASVEGTLSFAAHAERICGTWDGGSVPTVAISWSAGLVLPEPDAPYRIDVHTNASEVLPSHCAVVVGGQRADHIPKGNALLASKFVTGRPVVDLRFECPGPGDDDMFASNGCVMYDPANPRIFSPPRIDPHLTIHIRAARCPGACD